MEPSTADLLRVAATWIGNVLSAVAVVLLALSLREYLEQRRKLREELARRRQLLQKAGIVAKESRRG